MKRRTFITGLGATAVGSAAIVSSGAFFSAQADRGISLEVAEDSDAFLALESEREELVEEEDGELFISFDELGAGEGVAPGSSYDFQNVLTVRNQGAQEIQWGIDVDAPDGIDFSLSVFWDLSQYPANRDTLDVGESTEESDVNMHLSVDEDVDLGTKDDIEVTFIAEPTE